MNKQLAVAMQEVGFLQLFYDKIKKYNSLYKNRCTEVVVTGVEGCL